MERIVCWATLTVGLLLSSGAHAVIILDFDAAASDQFLTDPYSEDGFTIEVNSDHYDILGFGGDNIFNIDSQMFGLTTITLSMDGGGLFDVLSFDVIQESQGANQFDIFAIGGMGDISAPIVPGLFNFGAGFQGINALVIEQIGGNAGLVSHSTI